MSKLFKGISALVTGASSGIGEAFARELAREGADLILVARSTDRLDKLAQELKELHKIRSSVFQADLSLVDAPVRLFDSIQKNKLSVDLLINNAGFGYYGYFENEEMQSADDMLSVNIRSLVLLTHLFLPGMLQRGSGGIINVASTAAFQPVPFISLYSATKSFVLHFTEALWGEYQKRGIRILCLCPGNTRTEFHARANFKRNRVILVATPEKVARFGLQVYRSSRQPTAVYGIINRIVASAHRFVPRRTMISVTRRIYHP